jgi:hypothetical protein
VKLEPKNGWVIGRLAITKPSDKIVVLDPTKDVSKFILIESVSPKAEAEGYKRGDLVMPETIGKVFLMGGKYMRVTCPFDKIICTVLDVPICEFVDTDGKPLEPLEEVAAA